MGARRTAAQVVHAAARGADTIILMVANAVRAADLRFEEGRCGALGGALGALGALDRTAARS